MEMKLLFFLLSAILFQSSISIYAMEQIKRGWVALKDVTQMRSHSIFCFFLITFLGEFVDVVLIDIYFNLLCYSKNMEWDE